MKFKIINALMERWETEGNGFMITMKRTGKRYECYAQECGKYLITDKISLWDKETVHRIVNTVEELAEVIMELV